MNNGIIRSWEGDPQHCPVVMRARGLRDASQDLLCQMRQLRRAVLACRSCKSSQRCYFINAFNASIDAAINEVSEEWGLGAS
jgi:hypothetical protein